MLRHPRKLQSSTFTIRMWGCDGAGVQKGNRNAYSERGCKINSKHVLRWSAMAVQKEATCAYICIDNFKTCGRY